MELIKNVVAREILDSRGNPTLEVEIETDRMIARSCVPGVMKTGTYEARELRDNDTKRYKGKGVKKAVLTVNNIIRPQLVQLDIHILKQEDVDKKLLEIDGTENKSKIGVNTMLGVSLAFAKAKAFSLYFSLYKYFASISKTTSLINAKKIVLPVPLVHMLNGGTYDQRGLGFQEYMIIPVGAPTLKEAIRYSSEIFHTLESLLHKKECSACTGEKGGFSPKLQSNEEALDMLVQAIEKSDYIPGKDIFLGINAGASNFCNKEKKIYSITNNTKKENLETRELIDYYLELLKKYPILSVEDPFDEDDWKGFSAFKQLVGDKIQVAGNDLFVTNPKRIERGIQEEVANGAVIKYNQIGTVTEMIQSIETLYKHNWTSIISHRSGETEDSTIADIAVGLGTGQIKTGGMSRSDRIAKYNQLLRIEEKEGGNTIYPGREAFYNV